MLLLMLGSIVECSVQNVEAQKPYFMAPTGSPNMGLSLDNNGMLVLGNSKLPVTFGTKVKNDEPDVMYVDGKSMCMKNNTLSACQGGETGAPLRPKWKNNGIRVKHVTGSGIFGKSEVCLALQSNGSIGFEPCGDKSTNQEWGFTPAPSNMGNNNLNGGPNNGQGNGGPNGGSGGGSNSGGSNGIQNGGSGGGSNNFAGNNNGWNNCNNAQGYPMVSQANCYQQGTSYDQSNCSGMLLSGQQGCVPSQGYSMNGSGQGQQDCLPSSQNCAYPANNMNQMNGQNCAPMNGTTGQAGGQSCTPSGYSMGGMGQSGLQDCASTGYSMTGAGQYGGQGCSSSIYPGLSTMGSNGSCANMMGC